VLSDVSTCNSSNRKHIPDQLRCLKRVQAAERADCGVEVVIGFWWSEDAQALAWR
jgi:hypothetical protein